MSRRISTKKRFPERDSKYDNLLVSLLVNRILKNGKKRLAKRIVYKAFEFMEFRTNQNPILILEKAIRNISPRVQLKAKRVGGATYQVPTLLNKFRATNIAIQRTYTLLTYSYPELYIQNIGEGSNMYFYNTYALAPKLEKNKLYKLTVSIINVTVIFTVTTIGAPGNPYSKYIIDILYEVNFANQSATFGNPNNQAIYVVGQTVRTFNGDQPVIQLFVGN